MELQLPAALQALLYGASIALITLAVARVVTLLRLRGQFERALRAVEEMKDEVVPLAREMRAVVSGLHQLTDRAQGQMREIEHMVGIVRGWSEKANHLFEEVGTVVEPPLLAASRNFRILRSGLGTFLSALSRQSPEDGHQKARAS